AQRVGDTGAQAFVLCGTMYATHGPDDIAARRARIEQLIRLAEEGGDPGLAADGHQWTATHHLELGDIAAADREMQIVEGIAETSRQAYPRLLLAVMRAGRAFIEGRFADVEFPMARIDVANWEDTVDAALAGGGSIFLLLEQQGRT